MADLITGSVCLEDLGAVKDKATKAKNGKHYLNIALIPTPDSEFSTHIIVRGTSKEEREKGAKGEIIGKTNKWKDNNDSAPSSGGGDTLPF